jgi:hypothetical protein
MARDPNVDVLRTTCMADGKVVMITKGSNVPYEHPLVEFK